MWSGTSWDPVGAIQGPPGPQGEQGPQGEPGPAGTGPTPVYFKTRMNDVTNVNNTTGFQSKGALGITPEFQSGGFAVATTGVTVPEAGVYQVTANCYFSNPSTSARANPGIQFSINGALDGEISGSAYIRASSGHNEASDTLATLLNLQAGDVVDVTFGRLAGGATVALVGNSSSLTFTKIA